MGRAGEGAPSCESRWPFIPEKKVSDLIAAQGNFQPLTLASVNPRESANALARAK